MVRPKVMPSGISAMPHMQVDVQSFIAPGQKPDDVPQLAVLDKPGAAVIFRRFRRQLHLVR